MTTSTARDRSKTSAPLKSTPSSAPRALPTMMAVGVASPRAHGQAMMSTATAARIASEMSAPLASHTPRVTAAMATTTGTKIEETRSASRWTGAFEAWASSTRRTIWERAVSAPTRVARTRIRPCWFTVAPNTSSPGPLSTGMDSPVSMDSSREERPSVMTPSVGIFSPGRTTITSPGMSRSTGIVRSPPSRTTRASLAPSRSRLAMALDARPFALASNAFPRVMRVTIIPAVSKKTCRSAVIAQIEYR